jgi:hypothetical protein
MAGNANSGNKYGKSSTATNKSGKSAMHPTMGMTWKRALKIEKIARLSADPAGYSNAQIGNMLACSEQTIVYIRQTPEYHAKMMEISSGIVSMYDQQLRENIDNMRDEMRSMVPSAMMVIRNSLTGKYGPAIAFKAAQEVMDREGTNAKVSKSSVQVTHIPNTAIDPAVASNLMQLLAAAPVSSTSADIITGGGFTRSAQEALSQQTLMADDNTAATLEQLDLSKLKPN